MRELLRRLIDGAGALAGLFVLLIFLVMIVSTVMRTLGMRTGGTDDIVSWMTAAAAFFGLAHTFRHGDFVRVVLVLDKLGPRARHWAELAALAVGTVFTGYIALSVTRYVVDSWRFGDMAGGLVVIPIWIPQSSIAIGSTLLFIAMADQFVHVLRGNRPDYVVAVEERHARGDFSEDV